MKNDHEKRELITRDYNEGGLFIYNKSEANKIISLDYRVRLLPISKERLIYFETRFHLLIPQIHMTCYHC